MTDIQNLHGNVIVVGAYGSGKSEVVINLALARRASGDEVRVTDLDLVNPYFRTREAQAIFKDSHIDFVMPPDEYHHADLPILSPKVAGLLKRPGTLTLLDVGGDDAGARVLSALADALRGQSAEMLLVVNCFRPLTETVEACMGIKRVIEHAARLAVSGWIGNANLIYETSVDDILQGYRFMRALVKRSSMPLRFITAPAHLVHQLVDHDIACDVLPIHRQLVPPWRKKDPFGVAKNI
jgi:hypothetical protein